MVEVLYSTALENLTHTIENTFGVDFNDGKTYEKCGLDLGIMNWI